MPSFEFTPPKLLPLMAALAAAALLTGCNFLFFQPDQRLYFRPDRFNLYHEEVEFRSADGTRLTGWFLPAVGPPLATIVFFHGNAANISNHLSLVRWLPPRGYSVLLFDYRGYGASGGSAEFPGVIEDGAAAIEYVRRRADTRATPLIVYGQSLGGALAVNSLARSGTDGVKALIVEGSFASYQEVVRLIMNDTWIVWPFQYPVAYLFFTSHHDPADVLPQLANLPLLVVHGERDHTVPIEAGRQLFSAFPGADKQFWAVPNADHLGIFDLNGSPWRDKLLAYISGKTHPPATFRRQ